MKINISISTYIFILLSLLAGYFEYTFLTIIIIIVHEIGHFIGGLLVNIKLKEIDIFMFGGISIFDNNSNIKVYKEIIMLLFGPLIQLLFLIIVYILSKNGFIPLREYNIFYKINILLFKFNLLPILPLDGGKLLNNILDIFIPYNISHKISIIVSFIFLPCIYFMIGNLFSYILIVFIILKLIEEISIHRDKIDKLLIEKEARKYSF